MYFLLLELPGLKQLERVSVPAMENIRRDITTALTSVNGETVYDEGDFLLIQLAMSIDSTHHRALEAALQCLALLHTAHETLLGYTLLLDVSEEPPQAVFHSLRSALFRLRITEALWVGAAIWRQVDSYHQAEVDGEYHRISGDSSGSQSSRNDAHRFVVIERVVEQILSALDKWLRGEEGPGVVQVCGAYHTGALYNLEVALLTLFGGRNDWLSLKSPPTADADSLASFIYSLDRVELRDTPNYLNSVERAVWEQNSIILDELIRYPAHRQTHDRFEHRFLVIYRLYFVAALRRMRAHLLPPIVVLEEVERISEDSFAILASLMDGLPDELRPMVCMTSARQIPMNIATLKANVVIRVQRLDFDEIRAALARPPSGESGLRPDLEDFWKHTHGYALALYHYWVIANECRRKSEEQTGKRDDGDTDEQSDTQSQDTTPPDSFDLQYELETLISCLDEHERQTLFCATLMGQIVTADALASVLTTAGFDRHATSIVAQRLIELGLLRDSLFCIPMAPGLEAIMKRRYSETFTALVEKTADWCWHEWKQDRMPMGMSMLQIIERSRNVERSLEALFCVLDNLLDRYDLSAAERMLYGDVPLQQWTRGTQEIRTLQIILFVHRMRLATRLGDLKRMKQIYARRRELLDSGPYEGYMQLECARYEFVCGKLERAIALNKKAIVQFQKHDDSIGVNRAYIDFGHYLLVRKQLKAATQHFELARSFGRDRIVGLDTVRAVVMQAVSLFLYGNYSRAYEQAQGIIGDTWRSGLTEWELYAAFVAARTCFELGSYQKAAEQFSYAMSVARATRLEAAFRLNRIWLIRTLTYQGAAAQVPDAYSAVDPTREALFFLAEAYEQLDEYERALECLERALVLDKPSTWYSLETIDWSGGFRSSEDRMLSGAHNAVLTNLITALQGFVLARNGQQVAGIQVMHKLTSVRQVLHEDPYNAYYLYLYSQILADAKRNEECTTVLSRAIKFSQERTGRIEHYGDRYAFQHNNWWNKRLLESARAHNLL